VFVRLISHQPAVLFSQNKPATSNQPAVLFSQNKSAPAISHQPNEQAARDRVLVQRRMPEGPAGAPQVRPVAFGNLPRTECRWKSSPKVDADTTAPESFSPSLLPRSYFHHSRRGKEMWKYLTEQEMKQGNT
jgi:hypothetical protein